MANVNRVKTARRPMTPEFGESVVRAYQSGICWCLRRKTPRKPFCGACWRALPKKLTAGLFATFGEEYALAYGKCCEYLREAIRARERGATEGTEQ